MSLAFNVILGLIAAIPVMAFVDGAVARHLAPFFCALFFILFGGFGPTNAFAATLAPVRRLKWALLAPPLWILFQLAPLPSSFGSHFIWQNTASALHRTLFGHVTVDLGATSTSLALVLAGLGIVVIAASVAVDRQRAETILLALCAITTIMVIWELIARYLGDGLPAGLRIQSAAQTDVIAILSILLNLAGIFRTLERRRRHARAEAPSTWPVMGACLAGLVIGILASATAPAANALTLLCAAVGLTIFVVIFFSRRFAIGIWIVAGFCVALLAAAVVIVGAWSSESAANMLPASFTRSAGTGEAISQMLLTAGFFGNGVGTFPVLISLYRDASAGDVVPTVSTATLAIIEWGWIGSAILLASIVWVAHSLLAGSLQRGRDFFFAAAAAASLASLFCVSLYDTVADPTVMLLTQIIVGMGIAQSEGKSKTN